MAREDASNICEITRTPHEHARPGALQPVERVVLEARQPARVRFQLGEHDAVALVPQEQVGHARRVAVADEPARDLATRIMEVANLPPASAGVSHHRRLPLTLTHGGVSPRCG